MKVVKYALRNLRRHLMFSIINLAGLALGIACAFLIGLHVLDELKYDKFHAQADKIYRIITFFSSSDGVNSYSNSATPIAPLLFSEVPEIKAACRLYGREAAIQLVAPDDGRTEGGKFREPNFYFADSSIFHVFSFEFLQGTPETAFSNPNSIILSEEMALKYFGSIDILGTSIVFEERMTFFVAGIIKDWPDHSHLQLDFIAPFENFFLFEDAATANYLRTDWTYTPVSTYVVLKEDVFPSSVEEKLQALIQRHSDDFTKSRVRHELQPLISIRLYSDFTGGSGVMIRELYVIGSAGLLALLVACFNFINLSMVASLKRAKEAGIKKTLGAGRKVLAFQFFTESGFTVLIGASIGLLLALYALPLLNQVTDKSFGSADLFQPQLLAFLMVLLLFVILLACSYPAINFSSINPVHSLKGNLSSRLLKGRWLRRVLVMIQLGVSLALLSATFVVYQQMKYIRSAPLGFQKEHMLLIPLFSENLNSILGGGVDGTLRQRMNSFEEALSKLPGIESTTLSSALPGQGLVSALITTDNVVRDDNLFMSAVSVDYDYLETYKMELLAGRSFSRDFGTDHLAAFIINEQALAPLGWNTPEAAHGQNLEAMGKQGKVVGVIKNYHFQGLREAIRPLVLEVAASKFVTFTVRLKNENIRQSIDALRNEWDQIFPEKVFEYTFLNEELDSVYRSEKRLGQLVSFFSIVSFLISCIGLFGIASYMHLRRTKEIGIRKVLGASLKQLFATLSKEFMYLTLAAILFFGPLVYLLMQGWLNDFAYRIDLTLIPFALSSLICGIIVFATIGVQTFRSASIDPVKALKYE